MKNFLIDGIWQGPPEGVSVETWLNEVVAYSGLDANLQPTGIIQENPKNRSESARMAEAGELQG